jgi:CheY-like chemotaxis protein
LSDTEKINILLVDDYPENLLVMDSLLESPELNLHKAASGNEALGLLLENEFALVLLDVQMPEMDGFETAELMRGNRITRSIPIIIRNPAMCSKVMMPVRLTFFSNRWIPTC